MSNPATKGSFFTAMRSVGLTRSHARLAGGVAAGIAKRWNIDPLLARAAVFAVIFLLPPLLALYGAAWLLLPAEEDGRILLQEAIAGRYEKKATFLAALAVFMGLVLMGKDRAVRPWGWQWPYSLWLISVTLIAVAIWFAVRSTRSETGSRPSSFSSDRPLPTSVPGSGTAAAGTAPVASCNTLDDTAPVASVDLPEATDPETTEFPADATYPQPLTTPLAQSTLPWQSAPSQTSTPPEKTSPITLTMLGLWLITTAGIWAAARLGFLPPVSPWMWSMVAFIGFAGLGAIIKGACGQRARGLVAMGLLVAVAAAPLTLMLSYNNKTIFLGEDSSWSPTTAPELQNGYSLAAGKSTVDLTKVKVADSKTTNISLGVGHLTVIVPANVPVTINTKMAIGSFKWPNTAKFNGIGTRQTTRNTFADHLQQSPTTGPALTINLKVGLGAVTIQETES